MLLIAAEMARFSVEFGKFCVEPSVTLNSRYFVALSDIGQPVVLWLVLAFAAVTPFNAILDSVAPVSAVDRAASWFVVLLA